MNQLTNANDRVSARSGGKCGPPGTSINVMPIRLRYVSGAACANDVDRLANTRRRDAFIAAVR